MSAHAITGTTPAATLARTVLPYAQPCRRKALWQVVNTFVPYFALWALMVVMLQRGYPYWAVLALTLVAAAFYVRIFILFHDCCHGSFFASRKANRILGYISGIATFTPFEQWRRSHAMHHDTVGDLDRRGVGDIWTLTAEEFRTAPPWKRLAYRLVRNIFFVITFGTLIIFLIGPRYFHKLDRKPERRSVIITNIALLVIIAVASVTIGLQTYLMIQLPTMLLAGAAGLWLFYVQHQFEGTYWARHQEWDPMKAALQGSSFYRLPKVLQWFTGNIGFHHIHHIQQRIPNYNLERCYKEVQPLQEVKPLTLLESLRCARLHLWDESSRRLKGYRSLNAWWTRSDP
jgi:omega-6 fatty acid desaturase (delta-12 desaturase)